MRHQQMPCAASMNMNSHTAAIRGGGGAAQRRQQVVWQSASTAMCAKLVYQVGTLHPPIH